MLHLQVDIDLNSANLRESLASLELSRGVEGMQEIEEVWNDIAWLTNIFISW
jgi:hypothetical protein